MDRNDKILALSLIGTFTTLLLIVYAPSAVLPSSFAARLWSLGGSGFMVALVGSLAGAFAGAIGAQMIAERTAAHKNLLAEIAATNFAIATSHSVVNAYLNFKKQIISDVCADYWLDRASFLSAAKAGEMVIGPNIGPRLDYRLFETPFSALELLQRELQEKVRPGGASLAFFAMLREGIDTLGKVLAARMELISHFRTTPLHEQYAAYFAIMPDGSIMDGTYAFQMKMIEKLADDCIGTGMILSELLEKHGRQLAKKYGSGAPRIVHVIVWSEDNPDLVPDMTRYRGWLEKSFIGLQ